MSYRLQGRVVYAGGWAAGQPYRWPAPEAPRHRSTSFCSRSTQLLNKTKMHYANFHKESHKFFKLTFLLKYGNYSYSYQGDPTVWRLVQD